MIPVFAGGTGVTGLLFFEQLLKNYSVIKLILVVFNNNSFILKHSYFFRTNIFNKIK